MWLARSWKGYKDKIPSSEGDAMNGQEPPNTFSDFLSPTTSDEGPVSTRNIPRKRVQKRRHERKKRRSKRAS